MIINDIFLSTTIPFSYSTGLNKAKFLHNFKNDLGGFSASITIVPGVPEKGNRFDHDWRQQFSSSQPEITFKQMLDS